MTKKTSTTTPTPSGPAFVTDIQHEEVKSNGELAQVARVMTPEETAQQEIKKFNLADSAIAALKEKYGGLKISGPEDKEGYKIAREAWGEVRTIRTGLTKKGKELRDGYNLIAKKIIKEEDRLVELITPLEDELYKTWKAIDEEKERAENERKAAEEKGFMERLETLQNFGMVLDGGFYSIGEAISLDAVTLRSMPEEQFLKLRGKAEAIFQEEQIKQVNQLRLAREKVAKEKAEREEFERQQKELAEQRAQMERDREAMENLKRAQEAQLLELRVNKFLGLGLKKVGGQLIFSVPRGEISVVIESLHEYSSEGFQDFFNRIKGEIEHLQIIQAQEDNERESAARERERREKFIAERMDWAGFKYSYQKKEFVFDNEKLNLAVGWEQLFEMNEAIFLAQTGEYRNIINNAKTKAAEQEKERQAQAEAERKAGMKDAQLFKMYLDKLFADLAEIAPGQFRSHSYQNRAASLIKMVDDVLNTFK